MGPSVEGFFQDRPSPETWHSSTRRDLTSYLSDYRSSGERLKHNMANKKTNLVLSCKAQTQTLRTHATYGMGEMETIKTITEVYLVPLFSIY